MKIQKIYLHQIAFTYTSYEEVLKNSILRIGLSFPIKVILSQEGYECLDGHKRLSILFDEHLRNNAAEEIKIPCIVMDQARTDNGWSRMRHH